MNSRNLLVCGQNEACVDTAQVKCDPAAGTDAGGEQEGAGWHLEAAVLGSTLSSATTSTALRWGSALAARVEQVISAQREKDWAFFPGKAACFPIPCFGKTSTALQHGALSSASLFPRPSFPSP